MAAKKVAIKKGMGFKKVAGNIAATKGVSPQAANAILASATRKASPAAKKKNPNLKKVLVKKKGKGIKSGSTPLNAAMPATGRMYS